MIRKSSLVTAILAALIPFQLPSTAQAKKVTSQIQFTCTRTAPQSELKVQVIDTEKQLAKLTYHRDGNTLFSETDAYYSESGYGLQVFVFRGGHMILSSVVTWDFKKAHVPMNGLEFDCTLLKK